MTNYPSQGVDIPNIGSLYFRKSGRYFGSAIGAAMAALRPCEGPCQGAPE